MHGLVSAFKMLDFDMIKIILSDKWAGLQRNETFLTLKI